MGCVFQMLVAKGIPIESDSLTIKDEAIEAIQNLGSFSTSTTISKWLVKVLTNSMFSQLVDEMGAFGCYCCVIFLVKFARSVFAGFDGGGVEIACFFGMIQTSHICECDGEKGLAPTSDSLFDITKAQCILSVIPLSTSHTIIHPFLLFLYCRHSSLENMLHSLISFGVEISTPHSILYVELMRTSGGIACGIVVSTKQFELENKCGVMATGIVKICGFITNHPSGWVATLFAVMIPLRLIRRVAAPFRTPIRLFSADSKRSDLQTLHNKNFLCISQLSQKELLALLSKAQELKNIYGHAENKKKAPKPLENDTCSMIFQKRSTRTRISSEIGMHLLGGKALFLSSDDIQLGVNETLKDTALVLSRFSDVILARVNSDEDIKELATHATVPVINALSDRFHPLQALADYMTITQHFGRVDGLTIAWIGDGNNVLHDYMIAAAKLGANIQIATPKGYEPAADVIEETQKLAKHASTRVLLTQQPEEAVQGAHVIATDTWISMGQENESKKRVKDFAGYQVSDGMLQGAARDHIFLHCLPRHSEEVTDDVFYSKRSLVFDEAENRLWTVMAVYASLLGKA
uniref:ornithine carbamoyltransferase n=1 Tax=Albugo laibachii Nc14 TaxID=890382 RepID=F0W7X7_9STRA|nr:hypothetical protein THAPSDRAFT_997 [Albugo laibachii Nc14]CCA23704.1 hypothetical protein THAPSDRAFT_997 [Albugo laibachii Nc14]|eukprot:CCA23704.1 hypothetical protein THAPSDRAFT_997 [Albugo laibachii Nc14]